MKLWMIRYYDGEDYDTMTGAAETYEEIQKYFWDELEKQYGETRAELEVNKFFDEAWEVTDVYNLQDKRFIVKLEEAK